MLSQRYEQVDEFSGYVVEVLLSEDHRFRADLVCSGGGQSVAMIFGRSEGSPSGWRALVGYSWMPPEADLRQIVVDELERRAAL